jgi:uncharacterized protein with HEPN domain
MQRHIRTRLRDISEAIRKINQYTQTVTFPDFLESEIVQDAVVRNLEIIGEATRHIPEDTQTHVTAIEWRKIAGLRNILAHAYFGVDLEIIWDVIKNELPKLAEQVAKLMAELD